jgi:hypothetical protein
MVVVNDIERRSIAGTMQGTLCEGGDMVVIRSVSGNYIIGFCSILRFGFDTGMVLS